MRQEAQTIPKPKRVVMSLCATRPRKGEQHSVGIAGLFVKDADHASLL
jgi:hypothetical protein